MTSGKILATVVGVAAAAILITQLACAKSEEEPQLVENWINVALGPQKETTYTCAKTGKNVSQRDLTSHLPQSVFFGNSQLQPSSVIAATNVIGNTNGIASAGAQVQYTVNNPSNSSDSAQVFNNFAQAASIVEPFSENYATRSGAAPPVAGCSKGRHSAQSSSYGCGPAGTIANGYGQEQANALGTDFNPYEGNSLPTSHMDAYELPGGTLNTLDSAGNPQSFYMTDRLMYSTLRRARCPGAVDMIRGDLAIIPKPQMMMSAARPSDTLETGAFNAMNGAFATTPQATAALVSADAGSVRRALGGGDLTQAVMSGDPQPVLTAQTFVPSSALLAADNINMAVSKNMMSNSQAGDAKVVVGYTSY